MPPGIKSGEVIHFFRSLAARRAARYACRPLTPTMLTFAPSSDSAAASTFVSTRATSERSPFIFVGERLWLDFVNCEQGVRRFDALRDFETMVRWLEAASLLDGERAAGIRRRAQQQPAGAAAALIDARRVRAAMRALAERGTRDRAVCADAVVEINRVLGRSAGTRRLEARPEGGYARSFVP